MSSTYAKKVTRDICSGFLSYLSDKKWDAELEETLYSDLIQYLAADGYLGQSKFDSTANEIIDGLKNLARVVCPKAF
mgnify:CR=1 FL=1|tara:strand:- start:288 stop:518 length:231 start_codon:yes stop_codon:yes gene_type:complete